MIVVTGKHQATAGARTQHIPNDSMITVRGPGGTGVSCTCTTAGKSPVRAAWWRRPDATAALTTSTTTSAPHTTPLMISAWRLHQDREPHPPRSPARKVTPVSVCVLVYAHPPPVDAPGSSIVAGVAEIDATLRLRGMVEERGWRVRSLLLG